MRNTARPALLEDVHQPRIVHGGLAHKILESVAELQRDRLLNCDVSSSGYELVRPIPYLLSRDNCRETQP
jgi:hypothetical protein